MPVVTAVKSGCEFTRRRNINIAVENMTDFVWILLLDARQRQLRESLCGVNVKSAKGRIRRGELWSTFVSRDRD
jgi:hypothetical protein